MERKKIEKNIEVSILFGYINNIALLLMTNMKNFNSHIIIIKLTVIIQFPQLNRKCKRSLALDKPPGL